ncbi:MAG: hypothetical protein ACRC42_01190 [Mycoplasma sp.]
MQVLFITMSIIMLSDFFLSPDFSIGSGKIVFGIYESNAIEGTTLLSFAPRANPIVFYIILILSFVCQLLCIWKLKTSFGFDKRKMLKTNYIIAIQGLILVIVLTILYFIGLNIEKIDITQYVGKQVSLSPYFDLEVLPNYTTMFHQTTPSKVMITLISILIFIKFTTMSFILTNIVRQKYI